MAAVGELLLFEPASWQGTCATSVAIDSATDAVYFVFSAPNSGPVITKCAIRWGALTGTAPTYRLSLQGVDATGYADGTIKSGSGSDDVFFNVQPAAGVAGTVVEYTFGGGGYNSAPGEILALVVDWPNAGGTTPDGSNNWSVTYRSILGGFSLPYSVTVASGSPSKVANVAGVFGISDGTTWWGNLISGSSYVTAGSDPVAAGMKFTLPAGLADTVTCVGWWGRIEDSVESTRAILYDASDNVLATTDLDKDHSTMGTSAGTVVAHWDDAAVSLTCGSTYRLVITDTSSTIRVYYNDVVAAAHWDAYPWQRTCQWTQGTTGSWTETATRRFAGGPIISDITEPAASSGGMTGQHTILGLGR